MSQFIVSARKYEVAGLIKSCSAKIVENIKPDNAMLVLDKCASTLDEEIEKRAVEVVSQNTNEVFNTEAFLKATNRAVASILRSNCLSISEVNVFQAVYLKFVKFYFKHRRRKKRQSYGIRLPSNFFIFFTKTRS
jgi:hypothetical protein